MNKALYALLAMLTVALAFTSCNDSETYADQKKRERTAIQRYITEHGIKILDEDEFESKGCVTDTTAHEFVYLSRSGVYMQILEKGCGKPIGLGENATVLCRYSEYNLLTDSLASTNKVGYYITVVDKMNVINQSGTFTASFVEGESLMYTLYGQGSLSVPKGWLVPLSYVNVGRPAADDEKLAHVRIIVPHAQGHSYQTSGVYPCLYDLTYQRGR